MLGDLAQNETIMRKRLCSDLEPAEDTTDNVKIPRTADNNPPIPSPPSTVSNISSITTVPSSSSSSAESPLISSELLYMPSVTSSDLPANHQSVPPNSNQPLGNWMFTHSAFNWIFVY